jgi:hypothetical protein
VYFLIPYNVSFWVVDFDNDTCICEVGRDDYGWERTGIVNISGVYYRYITFRFDAVPTLPMVLNRIGEGMLFFFVIMIITAFILMGFGISYMMGVDASFPYIAIFGMGGVIVCVGFGLIPLWWIALIVSILLCALIFRYIAAIFQGGY